MKIKIDYWNPGEDRVDEVIVDLEAAIRDPGGCNMIQLGLVLFNIERKKRGLTQFIENKETGTFDEVPEETK